MSETQQNIDLSQASINMPNRRMRRNQMRGSGILKIKNMFDYSTQAGRNFRLQQMEAGRKLAQQNQDQRDQRLSEQMMARMERVKANWKANGWNDAEITLMEEAWSLLDVKVPETRREDTKRARQLMKQAQQMRTERKGS